MLAQHQIANLKNSNCCLAMLGNYACVIVVSVRTSDGSRVVEHL